MYGSLYAGSQLSRGYRHSPLIYFASKLLMDRQYGLYFSCYIILHVCLADYMYSQSTKHNVNNVHIDYKFSAR